MSETIVRPQWETWTMTPPVTCRCGTCQKCIDRIRQRELRKGVDRNRRCAADGCETIFYAKRANTVYCSPLCRTREAHRRYIKTDKAKARKRAWVAANPQKPGEYYSRWYQAGGDEVRADYKADRDKANAHSKVARAIKAGSLTRQPCEVCGRTRVDAHHPDYSRPLDVRWLCREHHAGVHSGEVVLSQRP